MALGGMTTETPTTEVFEDVNPDPDAILEEFGVGSPEELAAGDGAHDPGTVDEIDIDDTTAAELFDDLSVDAADAADGSDTVDGSAESAGTDTTEDATPFSADDAFFEEFEGVFVGEPATTVHDDDGVVDSTAADLAAVESMSEGAFEFGRTESADTDESTAGESSSNSSPGDDSTSASSSTLTVTEPSADLELVGPEPTPTRVTSDRFGSDLAAN